MRRPGKSCDFKASESESGHGVAQVCQRLGRGGFRDISSAVTESPGPGWAERVAEFIISDAEPRARAAGTSAPGRILVLGTGTEIGKTHVSVGVLRALAARGARALGIKPVESGLTEVGPGQADYERLGAAGIFTAFPRYGLDEPLSPHLAARRAGRALELSEISTWVSELERAHAPSLTWVETAGGAFSPLSETMVNADLIRELEPSLVLLVAPDRLGVLHDVGAALRALAQYAELPSEAPAAPPDESTRAFERHEGSFGSPRGSWAGAENVLRTPVHAVVLSASRTDTSSGTNGAELQRVVFPRFYAPGARELALVEVPFEP